MDTFRVAAACLLLMTLWSVPSIVQAAPPDAIPVVEAGIIFSLFFAVREIGTIVLRTISTIWSWFKGRGEDKLENRHNDN